MKSPKTFAVFGTFFDSDEAARLISAPRGFDLRGVFVLRLGMRRPCGCNFL